MRFIINIGMGHNQLSLGCGIVGGKNGHALQNGGEPWGLTSGPAAV